MGSRLRGWASSAPPLAGGIPSKLETRNNRSAVDEGIRPNPCCQASPSCIQTLAPPDHKQPRKPVDPTPAGPNRISPLRANHRNARNRVGHNRHGSPPPLKSSRNQSIDEAVVHAKPETVVVIFCQRALR